MYARFVGKPEDAVRRARLGNPWWVVAGAVVGLCVCNGPVLFFTSGVFLKPIAVDMQWPRSTVSFALSLATLLSAVTTPILGRGMDRWGVRAVALPGVAFFTATLGLLALSPRSPPVFIVLAALAGVASTVQSPLPYAKAIWASFDECRGLALGIAMAGVGLGTITVPQIARALIDWGAGAARLSALPHSSSRSGFPPSRSASMSLTRARKPERRLHGA